MNLKNIILGLCAVVGVGCAGQAADEAPTGTTEGAVEVASLTTKEITGTFDLKGDKLRFEAKQLGEASYSLTMRFHKMVVDATSDYQKGRVTHMDAFAEDGSETSMTEDDQALMHAFVKAFEAKYPDIGRTLEGVNVPFTSLTNLYGQWIPAMNVKFTKFEDAEHGQTLCQYRSCNTGATGNCTGGEQYVKAGHDCWTCNGDYIYQSGTDAKCQSWVQIGNHYSAGTKDRLSSTTAWSSAGSPGDHGSLHYEIGECFGRYGGGCGTGTAYETGSLQHDHCVRNGHVITSSWCSDELTSATDAVTHCGS